MLATYGIDTLDPGVSTRRVWVLLERLPPQARRGGEQWSVEAELLAGLIDQVANLTWITLQAHGAKGVTRPQPVPRPPGRRAAAEAQADRGGWGDVLRQLSGIPGVVVKRGLRGR